MKKLLLRDELVYFSVKIFQRAIIGQSCVCSLFSFVNLEQIFFSFILRQKFFIILWISGLAPLN